MRNITIEISEFNVVDSLWSELIENFGFTKAKMILSQAIDLQKMNGNKDKTIPIVFSGTGGLALISIEIIKKKTIINDLDNNKIVIYNPKKNLYQILYEAAKL